MNELPYADESFSVVAAVDLLQEASVKPDRAIREMARVLRVGGFLVVLAPAYQWMLSRHDAAVDSVRRFTRRELHDFALRAGLKPEAVVDVISNGAAQSWQMVNRWETMAEGQFEFGFAVEWMRKDLRICLEESRRNGAELPVAALVDQFYADIVGMGGSRWDTSSLIARLNRPSQD